MTSTDDLTTVRLSGRDGLLAAIPAMLGFHPEESLVLVCLSGPRQRVGPVVRIDLHPPGEQPDGAPVGADDLHRYAQQYADEVALVCYTSGSRRPRMLDQTEETLRASGLDVLDVVVVRRGYAYPFEPDGSPLPRIALPGRGHPQVELMAAASALQGRAILPDREALRRSVAGPLGGARREALRAMQRAADQVAGVLGGAAGPLDRPALRRMRDVTVDRALDHAGCGGSVPLDTAALVALLVNDARTRDHLVARAVRELDRPWLAMVLAVARSTPDVDAAQICAVLALTAYSRGDGALAQVAIDRCLQAAPGHKLARLMLQAMTAGIAPGAMLTLTEASLNPDTDE